MAVYATRVIFFAFLLVSLAGCPSGPSQQPIKLANGESVNSAIARTAATLSPDRAAEFQTAAEVLAMHYSMKDTSVDPAAMMRATGKSIDGKTPVQIIAEYNKLSDSVKQELAGHIQSSKLLEKARKLRGK